MEIRITREADAIIATSAEEVKELMAYGARPGQVFVVPCGVDTNVFRPDGSVADRREGMFRIITFGRLVARKGIDTIIEALRDVPGAELVVAGGPDRADLDHDTDVRRLADVAAAQGVAERITFLGQVAHDELPR